MKMQALRRALAALCVAACLATALSRPAVAQGGDAATAANAAKALYFDRKYDAARQAWSAVARGTGSEGITALYWIAQCSEKLGEDERALGEYLKYIQKRPAGQLSEDARTSRVRIATRLVKAGKEQHMALLTEGLADSNRTVRYYSALQMCSLGAPKGSPAIGALQALVRDERDSDLVERAQLCLVKLGAASQARSSAPQGEAGRWFRVEVVRAGKKEVSVSMPLGLADLVLKSLPEDALVELRKKGFNTENFMGNLKNYSGGPLVDIVGDDGERIRIWIE